MWRYGCVLLLATLCLAQRPQSSSGERQIRLEDIERDNLAATQQKPGSPSPAQHQHQQQQQPINTREQQQQQQQHQQLAAYQQQLLLQQLQQQYFAPTPLAYGNFGGVPLMIIHSNQLGVGSPAGVPIQAYFVPEPQYLPQYQHPLYQPLARYQVPRVPVQRVPLGQELGYNSPQPSVHNYRQPQNYPSASVIYAGTPVQSAQNYQQTQTQNQQLYNAYNALYQQRQEKNSFAAGVKSTPAPPLKPQSQVYNSPSGNSAVYSNLKSFNYNQ